LYVSAAHASHDPVPGAALKKPGAHVSQTGTCSPAPAARGVKPALHAQALRLVLAAGECVCAGQARQSQVPLLTVVLNVPPAHATHAS